MGLERLVSILQCKRSNYDTDLFRPIMNKIYEITDKIIYDKASIEIVRAYRIVADHLRSLLVCIGDGIRFSNKGNGSVLRKIYRRAQYYCCYIFDRPTLLEDLVESRIMDNNFVDYFQELNEKTNIDAILDELKSERSKFDKTLNRGVKTLLKIAKVGNTISGEDMGRLYETHGLPAVLTKEIAIDMGITIFDVGGYVEYMKHHKSLS